MALTPPDDSPANDSKPSHRPARSATSNKETPWNTCLNAGRCGVSRRCIFRLRSQTLLGRGRIRFSCWFLCIQKVLEPWRCSTTWCPIRTKRGPMVRATAHLCRSCMQGCVTWPTSMPGSAAWSMPGPDRHIFVLIGAGLILEHWICFAIL